MLTYKNKGIYFGGVFDHEGPRHSIQSMFYNDLYAFDFERRRWYALGLKVPKIGRSGEDKKKGRRKDKKTRAEGGEVVGGEDDVDEDGSDDGSESEGDDEATAEDLLEQQYQNGNYFGYIDNDGNVVYINIDDMPDEENDEDVESERVTNEAGVGVDAVNISVSPHDTAAPTGAEEGTLEQPSPHPAPTLTTTPIRNDTSQESCLQLTDTQIHATSMTTQDEGKGAEWDDDCNAHSTSHDTTCATSLHDNTEMNPLRRFFPEQPTCPAGRINAALAMRGASLVVYGMRKFTDTDLIV